MTQGQALETWTDENTASSYSSEWADMLYTPTKKGLEIEWQQSVFRLQEIENLDADWDGEGAEKIDYDIIRSAEALFERLSSTSVPPSRIVPTQDGAIVIEWHNNGAYTEAEIETPYLVEWMHRSPQGTISHWDEDLPMPETEFYSPDILMSDIVEAA